MTEKSKVFISWSGDLSLAVAEILKSGLEEALQHVDAFISDDGIPKGTRGLEVIMSELATCACGIIVLTRENHKKPWVLFEAGAITGGRDKKRAIPFLVDVTPKDLGGSPLLQLFQGASVDQLHALIKSVNETTPLPFDSRLESATSRVVEPLKERISTAIETHRAAGELPPDAPSTTELLLNDILGIISRTHTIVSGVSPKPTMGPTLIQAAAVILCTWKHLNMTLTSATDRFGFERYIGSYSTAVAAKEAGVSYDELQAAALALFDMFYAWPPREGETDALKRTLRSESPNTTDGG